MRPSLLTKPLASLTAQDVSDFLEAAPPENLFLELKQDLPERDGGASKWAQGKNEIADKSRNDLAAEIVAFANGDGGTLLLGVTETKTEPKRPAGIQPLPEPALLARRLQDSIVDVVEPPLTSFEAGAVVTDGDGRGIVVLRVEPSLLAPHRVKANEWHAYVRRDDKKKMMSMREIQDMVLERDRAGTRFERFFLERENKFRLGEIRFAENAVNHLRWQIVAAPRRALRLPTTGIEMVPQPGNGYVKPTGEKEYFDHNKPTVYDAIRPILGGSASETSAYFGEQRYYGRRIREERYRDGRYAALVEITTPGAPEVSTEELSGWLLAALNWIELARHSASEPSVEFGIQFVTDNRRSFLLRPLGADNSYSSRHGRANIEAAISSSPIYEIGTADAMETAATEILVDLANSFGGQTWDWQIPRTSYELSEQQRGALR